MLALLAILLTAADAGTPILGPLSVRDDVVPIQVVDSADSGAQVFTAPQLTALLRAAIYGRQAPDAAPS